MHLNYIIVLYSFNIKLLRLLISEYFFFIPILISFINIWHIFFKNNISFLNKKNNWDNSISIKNIIIKQNPTFILKFSILINILLLIFLYSYNGYANSFWWSHFKINNYTMYLYSLTVLFSTYFLYISEKHIKVNNNYSIDYIFALLNIILFIPYIYLSNTLFTFFFIIELVSCSIFYKFVVSKISFNNNNYKDNFFSIFSKNYLNVLFYQYWSSFFSSVLIISSIYYMYIVTGTTEWSIFNFILNTNRQINYFTNNIFLILLLITIIVAFIIKLGIAPIQLYKIEIYKGLPFLSIFFYTAFYFLVFFLYFSLLIIYFLSSMHHYVWIIIAILSVIGIIYILSIIFDINMFKAFLAYSTIINSISFILIILTIIF